MTARYIIRAIIEHGQPAYLVFDTVADKPAAFPVGAFEREDDAEIMAERLNRAYERGTAP